MNKKQQTLNPEAAVEMVIKMQDRQTNAIEILSGLILQFEQINYVLHKIDEATCETGKGVDDAWNMLKNREGIWQGANIVQTYMSSFEKNAEDSKCILEGFAPLLFCPKFVQNCINDNKQ